MSEESGLGWPAAGEPSRPPSAGLDASAEMLGTHAAHLYDYCRALLGREDEAASTAQSALDSAQSLLHDPDRLRAWLFALARRQAAALSTGSAEELDYTPPAQLPAFTLDDLVTTDPGPGASRRPGDAVLPAFRALANRDREVLDLVYRHGIRPEDLPAVLGVPPEEAARRLAAAEEEFSELAALRPGDETAAAGDPGLDDIAGLPLAELPESVSPAATTGRTSGRRSPRRWRAAEHAAGRRPAWPAWPARWREWLAGAVAIPVAAVGIALVYLAGPAHTVGSSSPAARPPSGPSTPAVQSATSTPSPAAATAPAKHRASPGPSVAAVVPAAVPGTSQRSASPTQRPKASPKPSPTSTPSPTDSPSATPSPPPTGSPSPTGSASGSP